MDFVATPSNPRLFSSPNARTVAFTLITAAMSGVESTLTAYVRAAREKLNMGLAGLENR